jgi:NADPH:quinone reductase-like Zn-dependent oxidoreductase
MNMAGDGKRVSRRVMLASPAAAALAAAAGAAPLALAAATGASTASGVIGTVPRGKTTVWQIGEQKSFETLTRVERPIPSPGPGQALIRVHYAGIAARDQGIAIQMFPVPPGPRPATRIPLSEGSGEILAVGAGETRLKPGDRVTCCHWANWVSGPWSPSNYVADVGNTIDGWLGEMILLPTSCLATIPEPVSWEDAATVSGSGLTVWHALHEVAQVRSDDIVLTLGTGGVSTFGVLLAKAAGAKVVVTSSSDEKLAEMKKLGADLTVNYRANPKWGEEVVAKTGGRGASVVLENVGPATLDQSMAACAVNARVVMIGTGRPPANPPNMNGMYIKNLMLKAISAGSRTMLESLLAAMAQNRVKPVISKVVPYAEAVQAYNEIRDGDHIGKVIVKMI